MRDLQLSALLYHGDPANLREAVLVVNEMRRAGELVDADIKSFLWSRVYFGRLFTGQRDQFLAGLRGEGHAATFQWLYPQAQIRADRRMQWSFMLASLEEAEGQQESARSRFESLRQQLERERITGPIPDHTTAAIKRLARP